MAANVTSEAIQYMTDFISLRQFDWDHTLSFLARNDPLRLLATASTLTHCTTFRLNKQPNLHESSSYLELHFMRAGSLGEAESRGQIFLHHRNSLNGLHDLHIHSLLGSLLLLSRLLSVEERVIDRSGNLDRANVQLCAGSNDMRLGHTAQGNLVNLVGSYPSQPLKAYTRDQQQSRSKLLKEHNALSSVASRQKNQDGSGSNGSTQLGSTGLMGLRSFDIEENGDALRHSVPLQGIRNESKLEIQKPLQTKRRSDTSQSELYLHLWR